MATLYVENIPDDLYEALRGRARARRRSIAAEVLELLEQAVPTAEELKARQGLLHKFARMRAKKSHSGGSFPSAEEMQRQDRAR
jgi:plasmid stability protein